MVGRDRGDTAPQRDALPDAPDDELGGAVHQVRLQVVEEALQAAPVGDGEPEVGVDRERSAGDGHECAVRA